MTRQKHADREQTTSCLDERRAMYFDIAADDARIDAALGELRLLPTLSTTHSTDDLERRLREIVRWRMEHDSDF